MVLNSLSPDMDEEQRQALERRRMVEVQLRARGIRDEQVLAAMESVPRHLFVPEEHRYLAYADGPLPIGQSQTISQPYIVALMTQLLQLKGEEVVLEIGTGSGYQAAVLSHLAGEVHTVEQYTELARQAEGILQSLEVSNVHVHIGDGSLGWVESAPYAGIIVTAAAPMVPRPFLDQLAEGGRLVLPVGGRDGQLLQCWRRQTGKFDHDIIAPVAFVPLRGVHGWGEEDWVFL